MDLIDVDCVEEKQDEPATLMKGTKLSASITRTSTTSTTSSRSSFKRMEGNYLEKGVSAESSKRQRAESIETIGELYEEFTNRASIRETNPTTSTSTIDFDPYCAIATAKNMKTALAVLPKAEDRVQALRTKLDAQPINGAIRRAYHEACDYLDALSIWVRQDAIDTEDAVEIARANPQSPSFDTKSPLKLQSNKKDGLPDILPKSTPFCFVNGSIISPSLYGYVAKYDKVSKSGTYKQSSPKIERVAIKVYFKDQVMARQATCGKSVQENPIRELRIQQALASADPTGSQRVLAVENIFESQDKLFAVFPLLDQDMFSFVTSRERLGEDEAKLLFKAMVEAVHYCHSYGIVHRDISLENFLIKTFENDQGQLVYCEPVLIDFGLCSIAEHDPRGGLLPIRYTGAVGKTRYMAPEVFDEAVIKKWYDGPAGDVWSLGVCLFSMLTRYPPWQKADGTDKHFRYMVQGGGIARWVQANNLSLSRASVSLLENIFKMDPALRLSTMDILNHEWLSPCQA